ncbi:MAG: adenylate/guanylate cyclase domain-containing protein [Verrucomicrobiota bacterium]
MDPEPAELVASNDGTVWPIGETCVIGRSASADIMIEEPNISRQHAMIRRSDGGYSLFDLDSANGSTVNGAPVSEPVTLANGDRIGVADFEFVFHERHASEPLGGGIDASSTMMLTAQSQPMVFLVADVMGYTEISSKLPDDQLGELMAPWYEHCRKVLKSTGGQLDKFIGDCVFAYWKMTSPRERASALNAARQLTEYHLTPSSEQTTLLNSTSVDLKCGVALHIGEAAVGSFGRGNKTALGDEVNLTFRVEKLTRELTPDIVATAAFFEGWDAGRAMFLPEGEFELKGIDRKVEVFGMVD